MKVSHAACFASNVFTKATYFISRIISVHMKQIESTNMKTKKQMNKINVLVLIVD